MKLGLLAKVSVQYWKRHTGRLLTFLLIISIGSAALFSSALLIRSNKQMVLEEELCLLGEYDAILYNLTNEEYETIKQQAYISYAGSYLELGYAEKEDNGQLFKLASFEDDESEKMYHMSCLSGRYPIEKDEIAIDSDTAKRLGVKPEVGNRILLNLYDIEKQYLEERCFVISGVFEASDEMAYGGFKRYPNAGEIGAYEMPVIFLADSIQLFQPETQCVFIQSEQKSPGELAAACYELFQEQVSSGEILMESDRGRQTAYSYVLGITDYIYMEYGEISFESITAAIRNGQVVRDFYSGILVPVLAILILIITFFSVRGMIKSIMDDRREQIAVLRCIGVRRRDIQLELCRDLLCVTLIGCLIGYLLGAFVHILTIYGLQKWFSLKILNAFAVSVYVRKATGNPFIYPVLAVLIGLLCAMLPSIWKMTQRMPMELFQKHMKYKRKKKTSSLHTKSWIKLLWERMNLFDGSAGVVTCIVMGTLVFGYVFFCVMTDWESGQRGMAEKEKGVDAYAYVAERSDDFGKADFCIENKHDKGIEAEAYEQLQAQDYVEEILAYAWNQSTRITYKQGTLDDDMKCYLERFSLRSTEVAETDYERSVLEAENAMISAVGYALDEEIYSLPTIGIPNAAWKVFEDSVVVGELHADKLRTGEEVLLAVSPDELAETLKYFHAGDVLPMSDILLSDEEEAYDFNHIVAYEDHIVYREMTQTEDGYDICMKAYAFGKRKDIQTKIGAIIVIDEKNQEYFPTWHSFMNSEEDGYGLYAVCGMEAFAEWGLPDYLFTSLKMKLKDGTSWEQVDDEWYAALTGSTGIAIASQKEIHDEYQSLSRRNMCVYYTMFIMLVIFGLVSVSISLYSRIRMNAQEFAYLRAVGMKQRNFCGLLFCVHVMYPLLGIGVSTLPVGMCQLFFMYIRRMIDNGSWDGYSVDTIPWYHYVPFRYNLYDYHFLGVLLVVFLIYFVLTVLATVPGLYYMKKQNITDELEISQF